MGCRLRRRIIYNARVSVYVATLSAGTPPTSGGFCRKWVLISPWVLNFWVVFRRCCVDQISLTWGNVGAGRYLGINSLAKPPRSRERARRRFAPIVFRFVLRSSERYASFGRRVCEHASVSCSRTQSASIITINNSGKRMRRNRRVSQVYRWGAASAVGERI